MNNFKKLYQAVTNFLSISKKTNLSIQDNHIKVSKPDETEMEVPYPLFIDGKTKLEKEAAAKNELIYNKPETKEVFTNFAFEYSAILERPKQAQINLISHFERTVDETLRNLGFTLDNQYYHNEIVHDGENLYNHKNKEMIGKIYYYGVGGTIEEVNEYFDTKSYMKDITKQMDYDPNGFRYETLTSNPKVKKEVDDIIFGSYGLDNPHNIEFYKSSFLIDKYFFSDNSIEIDIPIKEDEILNFFYPELKELIIKDMPFNEDGSIADSYCQFIDGKVEWADEYEFRDTAVDQSITKISQIKAKYDIDNRISNINIFSLKEGGMAIKCKVDDIQYSSVNLEKDDLLAFSDTSNRNLLASKYYKDELNGCPSKRAELCTTDTRTLSAQVTLNNKRIIEVNNPMITEKLTGSSSQLDTKGIKLNSLTGSQMKDLLSGKTVSGIAGISGYLGLNKTPAGWTLSIGKKIINTANSEAEI